MQEPFDRDTARAHVLAILEGPGMTVFSARVKKDLLENDMTSLDAVNVLRGGTMSAPVQTSAGWIYRATTRRMSVEFSFRGQAHEPVTSPNELVLVAARRTQR